jgi:hypothetical protein
VASSRALPSRSLASRRFVTRPPTALEAEHAAVTITAGPGLTGRPAIVVRPHRSSSPEQRNAPCKFERGVRRPHSRGFRGARPRVRDRAGTSPSAAASGGDRRSRRTRLRPGRGCAVLHHPATSFRRADAGHSPGGDQAPGARRAAVPPRARARLGRPGANPGGQRDDPGPPGTAGHLRTGDKGRAGTRCSPRSGDRSPGDGGGRLGWTAAQLAQRRRGLRWRCRVVHRSELRPPAGLPARAAARRLRLPLRPGIQSPIGRGRLLQQAQRPGLLPRRGDPVRHRQRRQPGTGQLPRRAAAPHRGVRGQGGAPSGGRAAVRGHHAGVPRRHQGRRRGPGLRLSVQRCAGVQPRRRPDRRDPPSRRGEFTFGGPAGNVLFITTDSAVWAAVLQAKGA